MKGGCIMDNKDPMYTMFKSGQSKRTTAGMEYSKPQLINFDRMETAFGQGPCTGGNSPSVGACNAGVGGATNCINGSNPNMFCLPGFGF